MQKDHLNLWKTFKPPPPKKKTSPCNNKENVIADIAPFPWLHVPSYFHVRPGFLLVLILILWLCRDVEQRATPVAFFLVLHLFGTPCLVHISLHPMICHLLRGISIPAFSSTEFLHLYVFFLVALDLEWLLASFWANLHKKIKLKKCTLQIFKYPFRKICMHKQKCWFLI